MQIVEKPTRFLHENGYVALLYGDSSMRILKDGKEVLHTGSRRVNTKEEVMEMLEHFPEFLKVLTETGWDEDEQ